MPAKRDSKPRKRPANTKAKMTAKAPEAALTERAVLVILEATEPEARDAGSVDPEARRQLIAEAAYLLAERRGFAPGHEFDDWVAAEAVVESRLRQGQAA
jgi:hypothetical protein